MSLNKSFTPSIVRRPNPQDGNFLNLLIWFLLISVAVYLFLFYLLNPTILQTQDATGSHTGNADAAKTLLASIIIAIFIVFAIYIFKNRNTF